MSEIQNVPIRRTYVAQGETTFAFPFYIFNDFEVIVEVNGVRQTINSDYTVEGVQTAGGGRVVFNEAPTSGDVVLVRSELPVDRTSQFQDGAYLAPDELNVELSRIVRMVQQLADEVGRTIRLEADDTGNGQLLLLPAQRANRSLAFNEQGQLITVNTAGQNVDFTDLDVETQFSADGNAPWDDTFEDGVDQFYRLRFSIDSVVSDWGPALPLAQSGTPGTPGAPGADGQSLQRQYSDSDQGPWRNPPALPGDRFFRERIGDTAPWGAAIELFEAAEGIEVQWSATGTAPWTADYQPGISLFLRQRIGNGAWSPAIRVVGENGANGADGADGAPGAPGQDGSDGSNGAPGASAVYGGVNAPDGSAAILAFSRAPDSGEWTPNTLVTDLRASFFRAGQSIATSTVRVTVDNDTGNLSAAVLGSPTGEATTFAVAGAGTRALTVRWQHTASGAAVSESVIASLSGDSAVRRYIRPIDGTIIRVDGVGAPIGPQTLNVEARQTVGGEDEAITNGTIRIYDGATDLGFTAAFTRAEINGALNLALRDGPAGEIYDIITLVDVQDGADGTSGTDGEDGQDGADGTNGDFWDVRFRRLATQPATPTGNNPTNWFDAPPPPADLQNPLPLWLTRGLKTSAGVLIGTWSEPIRINGADALPNLFSADVNNPQALPYNFRNFDQNTVAETIPIATLGLAAGDTLSMSACFSGTSLTNAQLILRFFNSSDAQLGANRATTALSGTFTTPEFRSLEGMVIPANTAYITVEASITGGTGEVCLAMLNAGDTAAPFSPGQARGGLANEDEIPDGQASEQQAVSATINNALQFATNAVTLSGHESVGRAIALNVSAVAATSANSQPSSPNLNIQIQRRIDGGTWNTIRTFSDGDAGYVEFNIDEPGFVNQSQSLQATIVDTPGAGTIDYRVLFNGFTVTSNPTGSVDMSTLEVKK